MLITDHVKADVAGSHQPKTDEANHRRVYKQSIPTSSLTLWSLMMIIFFIAGIALRISTF